MTQRNFQLSERSFFLARSGVCQRTGSDRVMSARLLDARLGDKINAKEHYRGSVTQHPEQLPNTSVSMGFGTLGTFRTAVCRHNPMGRVRLHRISLFPQPRCSITATPSVAAPRSACKRIPARRARCSDSLLKGKSSGSGHNWPLRTDLSRITKPEETRSAQAARSSCKIRVAT